MTEEQIKRNAEDYADRMCQNTDGDKWQDYYDSFIEGSNCRQDEFFELLEECKRKDGYIGKLLNKIQRLNEDLTVRKAEIEDMEFLLNQKRNPWINVNDQLPTEREEGRFNYKSKPVFAKVQRSDGTIYHLVTCYYFDNNEEPQDGWLLDTSNGDKITHWMKIP